MGVGLECTCLVRETAINMTQTMTAVWNARCKSGLEFERVTHTWRVGRLRIQKVAWAPCKRVCARGELVCAECHTAQAIEVAHTCPPAARVARVVRGAYDAYVNGNDVVNKTVRA